MLLLINTSASDDVEVYEIMMDHTYFICSSFMLTPKFIVLVRVRTNFTCIFTLHYYVFIVSFVSAHLY